MLQSGVALTPALNSFLPKQQTWQTQRTLKGDILLQQEVRSILADFGQGSGHVFNLGHGIHQDVPESAPKIFVDTIHEFSKAYHK